MNDAQYPENGLFANDQWNRAYPGLAVTAYITQIPHQLNEIVQTKADQDGQRRHGARPLTDIEIRGGYQRYRPENAGVHVLQERDVLDADHAPMSAKTQWAAVQAA